MPGFIILFFRLLRQGVIEAKTRGSRKQRKEKKNRTKKVRILITTQFGTNQEKSSFKFYTKAEVS